MIVTQRLPRPLRHSFMVITGQPAVRFALALAKRISADDIPGLAAEMAYHFLFALFPFLIFIAALVGFIGSWVGSDNLFVALIQLLAPLVPPEVQRVINEWVAGVVSTHSTGLLTFGAVGALW